MIRQARRYLVGAVSSVTLVSIAIVVFVLLVSAQVFTDWPVAALGGEEKSGVSAANAVSGEDLAGGPAAPKTVNPNAAAADTSNGTTAPRGDRRGGGETRVTAPQDNTSVGSSAPPVNESEAVTGSPSGGGNPAGDGSGEPSSSSPSQSAPSSSGGGSTPASNSSGGSKSSGGSSSGGSSSGGGGSKPSGGNVVEEVTQPVTSGSTTAKVTETVNSTVNSVDETVTGGALKEAGVTGATEEVVNGVVGPESVVGKTVDETVNAVGGLLGGKK